MNVRKNLSRFVVTGTLIAAVLANGNFTASAYAGRRPAYDKTLSLPERWMTIELYEFHRLVNSLRIRRAHLRRMRNQLENRRVDFLRMAGGDVRPTTKAAFRRIMKEFEMSPTVKGVFLTPVESIGAEQFVSKAKTPQLLQVIELSRSLPPALVPESENDPLAKTQARFAELWETTVETIQVGNPIPQSQIDQLNEAVDDWKQAARIRLLNVSRIGRIRAKNYFKSVARLVKVVENPQGQVRLARLFSGETDAFPGGSMSDLLHHVLDNNLSVRSGSRAQLALSELSHDMVRNIDARIAVLDSSVERLNAQNPSHNAALKARIAPSSLHSGRAGLNSPAYGRNFKQHDGVFNPPQYFSSAKRLKETILQQAPIKNAAAAAFNKPLPKRR